jgi:hypothetical protein
MITRKQYLDRENTHREYYSQFVTEGVKNHVRRLGIDNLKAGKDDHFNNIPLNLWDSLMPIVPFEIGSVFKKCGDYPTKAGIVCILKEAAQQLVEKL